MLLELVLKMVRLGFLGTCLFLVDSPTFPVHSSTHQLVSPSNLNYLQSVCPSIHSFIHLSIHHVHPAIPSSICPSICPTIDPYIPIHLAFIHLVTPVNSTFNSTSSIHLPTQPSSHSFTYLSISLPPSRQTSSLLLIC